MRAELVTRLEAYGDRPAVVDGDVPHTYGDLLSQLRSVEEILRAHDVQPHDVVILNGDFSFLSIATLLALYMQRTVIVPIVTLTDGALHTVSTSCFPKYVVKVSDSVEIERLAAGPGEDRSAGHSQAYAGLLESQASGLVLLSSGTSGAPKAILHNLDSIVEERLGTRMRGGAAPLNMIMFLLFDHIGGINSLLSALRVGGTAIVPRERTPEEICALVETYRIRILPTSPTFLNLILIGNHHEHYDLSSLRMITYGTEPMPETLLERVNLAFPRAKLLQTFGTSETGISTTRSESSNSTFFKIDDPNVQHRIVDGELQLKAKTQFIGYMNYSEESLTEDAWFKTGDLVEENSDGFIKVKGRAKEVINVGGEKVLPLELESILLSSPLVDDCLVFGEANAITGQSVRAHIKPSRDMSRAEVRKHVRGFLAGKVEPFKIPSKIDVVDTIATSERFKKRRVMS
jgi:acyl-coenzyme A synthetase/AMP-(fatty) acid ligase